MKLFSPTRKHQPAKEISFIYVETVNSGRWREGKKRRKKKNQDRYSTERQPEHSETPTA